ncbi:hypothetical protein IV203_033576 [Nitzschia inconspicua]|uniref:Uncharacterized protein n=1 Tax=Nitzschia inconspicua TaxID=303405 RepID=A0A9K3Q643_9STRA|nr:hypothetical protein IV203_033576 [Nitzschia inconspicua]
MERLLIFALFLAVSSPVYAQFKITAGTVPDPWNVDEDETNTVSFECEFAGQPTEQFAVVTTKCGSDSSYSISSTDDVSDVKVAFTNNENIVNTEYCVDIVLTWNNGINDVEAASLQFKMEVEATQSDTETKETETTDTSFQVVPQNDNVEMAIDVTRPPPPISLSVENNGPLYFGEAVVIKATSPKSGYEFELITAQSQGASGVVTDLSVVNGGPGPSGVEFRVLGFSMADFTGSSITMTLVIQWSVNGSGNNGIGNPRGNGNWNRGGNRQLQPDGDVLVLKGSKIYNLSIDLSFPIVGDMSSTAVTYSFDALGAPLALLMGSIFVLLV